MTRSFNRSCLSDGPKLVDLNVPLLWEHQGLVQRNDNWHHCMFRSAGDSVFRWLNVWTLTLSSDAVSCLIYFLFPATTLHINFTILLIFSVWSKKLTMAAFTLTEHLERMWCWLVLTLIKCAFYCACFSFISLFSTWNPPKWICFQQSGF